MDNFCRLKIDQALITNHFLPDSVTFDIPTGSCRFVNLTNYPFYLPKPKLWLLGSEPLSEKLPWRVDWGQRWESSKSLLNKINLLNFDLFGLQSNNILTHCIIKNYVCCGTNSARDCNCVTIRMPAKAVPVFVRILMPDNVVVIAPEVNAMTPISCCRNVGRHSNRVCVAIGQNITRNFYEI